MRFFTLLFSLRYHKFLLWLGVPPHRISESRPNEFCRILSEFALEYRTTRERVHQQIEKKANHRERNKTRGKLIIDVAKFKNGNVSSSKEESSKDAELRYIFLKGKNEFIILKILTIALIYPRLRS